MFAYITETHERCIRGQNISVVNLTPEFRWDEKNAAKKQIEMRLYEIFCKYVKDKT